MIRRTFLALMAGTAVAASLTGSALAQTPPGGAAQNAARLAALRAIIAANRNNPAALRAALAAYVAANPAAAALVSNAVATAGLPPAALAAVGNALADARASLAATGNTAAAAIVAAEVAQLPPAAQTAYTTTVQTGTTQPIVQATAGTPAQETGNAGNPPAAQTLPGGTGGGSGSSGSPS
jgi:hypothetical protein